MLYSFLYFTSLDEYIKKLKSNLNMPISVAHLSKVQICIVGTITVTLECALLIFDMDTYQFNKTT